jgi:hypothetical protein
MATSVGHALRHDTSASAGRTVGVGQLSALESCWIAGKSALAQARIVTSGGSASSVSAALICL